MRGPAALLMQMSFLFSCRCHVKGFMRGPAILLM
jgi:hypothetical protein